MAQATIARLPLRVLQQYLEQKYSTVDSRIWWSLSAKIDDALHDYGAKALEIIEMAQKESDPINAEIASDIEPPLSDRETDPDSFDKAMIEWNERNQRRQNAQMRLQYKINTAILALDEQYGGEIVTVDVNAIQKTFLRRKWVALLDLPADRRSTKINKQIDQFIADLEADKIRELPKRIGGGKG